MMNCAARFKHYGRSLPAKWMIVGDSLKTYNF